MKIIIITAADENFMKFLLGLLESLEQCPSSLYDAIGLLDVGLTEESINKIRNKVDILIKPTWTLNISPEMVSKEPFLQAKTERPFIREYFPGFDLYIWLDADTWVQNSFAIEWLIKTASKNSIALVPQIHPSYKHSPQALNWRLDRLNGYFSEKAARYYSYKSYYNSGVFALRREAPHWKYWSKSFQEGLYSMPDLVSDQTALNYAIWEYELAVNPLPSICNWCCHLSRPAYNSESRTFCEPTLPFSEIGIIHMTSNTKDLRIDIEINKKNYKAGYQYEDFKLLQNIN